jgi:hypothetical protein
MRKIILLATALGSLALATAANAGTITVSSMSNVFLAGLSTVPPNTTSPLNFNPAVGPPVGSGEGVLPVSLSVFGGEMLHLTATGTVSCCLGGSPSNGPDGGGLGGATDITPLAGMNVGEFVSGTQMALVGVFGGPGLTTQWSVFTIGSNWSGRVPTGATSLYLGIADALGFNGPVGWYNDNTGSFTVTVPEASTWAMLLAGFAGLGFAGYRGSRKARIPHRLKR